MTALTAFARRWPNLQMAYRERGYVTVSVGLPQQKLTNATVKVQVTEGRLAAINVTGNRYYSSNNVMRALPSLHTNFAVKLPCSATRTRRRQCQPRPANLSGHRPRSRAGHQRSHAQGQGPTALARAAGGEQPAHAQHA